MQLNSKNKKIFVYKQRKRLLSFTTLDQDCILTYASFLKTQFSMRIKTKEIKKRKKARYVYVLE